MILVIVNTHQYKIINSSETAFIDLKNSKVKKVKIPPVITWNQKKYKVTSIAKGACSGCKKLTTVTIGKMIDENILKNNLFTNVHKEHFKDYETGARGTYYSQKDVFDCIDSQTKIGEWIPCSEQLPGESLNSVIGWDEYRNRCCFVQYYGGRWILGDDTEPVKIIAWQPLPEGYHG